MPNDYDDDYYDYDNDYDNDSDLFICTAIIYYFLTIFYH